MAASSAASRSACATWSRIAEESLAPIVPDDDRPGFRRMIKREPLGIVFVVAPWNYPYHDGGQHHRPGADRRQCGDPQACGADHPGRRALPEGDGPGRPARRASSRTSSSRHDQTSAHPVEGPRRPRQLHRLGRRRPGDRDGGGRHLHVARPRARRQGPGLCPRRCQSRPRHREPRRRRLLQFRPVLLRHRAHLCA